MAKLAGVKFHGLDTFTDELRLMTADLVDEANAVMVEAAEAARRDIAAAYPYKRGNLRRGLVVRPARGTVIAGAELLQTAPHGWIFEHGTKARENRAGANRGRMTPRPIFEPIAHAYRRSAISDVIFRVYAHGATRVVNDEPAA